MNLQLNEPWLTDKTPAGGCAAAATADLHRKPDSVTARAAGNHSHLELTLGMPSSYSSSPDNRNAAGEIKGRATAQGCAAAFFNPHAAAVVADKSTASGTHAAKLIYQIPGSSSSGLGAKRWFSETAAAPAAVAAGVGFVHPWSLAARQEKAVLEQAARVNVANNQPSAAASSPVQQPPVVGWPPIRTYRKNVITNPRMHKHTADCDEKEAKKSKPCEKEEEKKTKEEVKPSSIFVKVNMEGFAVGRKIDLLAHDGYDSLSSALHKMFDNFLSVKNVKMTSEADKRNSGTTPHELVLLYEDHEGDRMLVGDVPWEMFVSSVKRLYISINPKLHGSVSVDEDKEKMKRDGEAALT